MLVHVVAIAVGFDVVRLEIHRHRNRGVHGAVDEEDVVEIGDGNGDGLVEGRLGQNRLLVEIEDREDEGVADDADVLQQGELHRVAGRGRAVEAAHEGQLRRVDAGFGGGDGD